MPASRKGSRAPLTKDRVLRAAIAFADEKGIESLSMRKLGQVLGVEAMSLYKHVANKEDMLDGMVDIVFGEIAIPSETVPWKQAMRERAISAREALSRHPWAIGLTESRVKPGPANLRHHDSVMRCLRQAGFTVAMAVHAYSALDSYIYGFALQEQSLPFRSSEEFGEGAAVMARQLPEGEYPHLAETVADLTRSGYDFSDEFEFGLNLMLDGLERVRVTKET